MNKTRIEITILICVICGLFSLGAKSCINRNNNKTKTGSSDIPVFLLNAPSNLSAIAVSTSEIRLTWQDNSYNEDGFEIERSINGTDYYLLTTFYSNVISYSDSGFVPFNTYYYRVRAFNTIGDRSGWSNEVMVDTTPVWSTAKCGVSYHNLAVTTDGFLWAWGLNNNGQLGIGDTTDRYTPLWVSEDNSYEIFSDVSKVSAGVNHSVALKTNPPGGGAGGTIWVWGTNGSGQLGTGDTNGSDWPYPMGTDSDWINVFAGGGYTFGIKTNNTFYSWGYNEFGQLGLGDSGTETERTTPTQVGTASDWIEIAPGESHTIGLKINNTIYSWGYNDYGQLGLGDSDDFEQEIYTQRVTPTQIGIASDWIEITAGSNFTLGRKTNSTIYSWGANDNGQLGIGNYGNRTTPTQIGTASDWIQMSAGYGHTICRKMDGTLYSWGYNFSGQLGLGDSGLVNNRTTPTQIGNASDWSQIAAGYYHTLVRKINLNSIYSWGYNGNGRLGLGDTMNRNVPTLVGE